MSILKTATAAIFLALVAQQALASFAITCLESVGGKISISPEKTMYNDGEEIDIIAEPEFRYQLKGFLVNGEATTNSHLTVREALIIKGVFEIIRLKPKGLGTEEDPFQISSVPNLVWFQAYGEEYQWSHFVLTEDLNLRDSAEWDEGRGFPPICSTNKPFRGFFDGQNHIIKNLNQNDANLVFGGLFAAATDADIRNLNIIGFKVSGMKHAGLLCGQAKRCYAEALSLDGQAMATEDAGLVFGISTNSAISHIRTQGLVTSQKNAGGLFGASSFSSVSNCYSLAEIDCSASSGGLIGYSQADSLIYTYYAGSQTNTCLKGGIAGVVGAWSAIEESYYALGQFTTNQFGQGLPLDDMKKQDTYANWDFLNVWTIMDGTSLPEFRHNVPTTWVLYPGLTKSVIKVTGWLSLGDAYAISENPHVCICLDEDPMSVTVSDPIVLPTMKAGGSGNWFTYIPKKRRVKYVTTTFHNVSIGLCNGVTNTPLYLSKEKSKITFSSELEEDISRLMALGSHFATTDPDLENRSLPNSKIVLSRGSGNTYKGVLKLGDTKVKCTVNVRNGKVNYTYKDCNALQVILDDPTLITGE